MIAYNLEFPDDRNDISIELKCYLLDHPPEKGGLGAAGHLRRAIKLLWPEHDENGRPILIWHDWLDRRIDAWCSDRIQMWWGPAASGKSTDAAVLALIDWYANPIDTTTIICSTTLRMLRRRIFGEIVRLHNAACRIHKTKLPGIYLKSQTSILLNPELNPDNQGNAEDEKSGIFGFAIQQGSKDEAKDNIIGQHNRRVRLLVDEAQHPITEVAFDARANLMKGCEDFKLVGFGNPDSRLTPLGRYSEPAAGWESIDPSMKSWKTKLGSCHYFDGLESPAIKDPDKCSFLIKQQDIDDTVEDTGYDSPDYWQFCRGYVRPEGTPMQIISETFAIKYHMTAKPEWADTFKIGAGFDPSYSSGGDRRVVVPYCVGKTTDGIMTVAFMKPFDIHIEATKLTTETFSRQMVNKVIEGCKKLGVEKQYFGMDTTGAQNVLADMIDESWDDPSRIHRVEFGGAPSELSASENDAKLAKDVYANRVTELWYNMVSFGRGDQIRNLPPQALKEFSIREILSAEKKKMRTTKRQIEPKTIMKERTGGKSPDEADACVISLDTIRIRMDVHPAASRITQKSQEQEDLDAVDQDIDDEEDLYQDDGM